MLTTLMSFLGGGALRALWGELSHLLTAYLEQQRAAAEHNFEIERLKLQESFDAAQHARNLEAQRLQAELGVQVIRVQSEADLALRDAAAFDKAVEQVRQPSGFAFIDAWNAAIRPALASLVLFLIVKFYATHGWVLDDRGWELAGGVLGVYIADRVLFRRGK